VNLRVVSRSRISLDVAGEGRETFGAGLEMSFHGLPMGVDFSIIVLDRHLVACGFFLFSPVGGDVVVVAGRIPDHCRQEGEILDQLDTNAIRRAAPSFREPPPECGLGRAPRSSTNRGDEP
jgi:hypothetical protein